MKKTRSLIIIISLVSVIFAADLKNLDDLKARYPGLPEYNQATINALGYRLLQSKKISAAIEVLKLNAALFPKSWNVYDSLAEAYAASGKDQLAIENYAISIRINPKNKNGKQKLEILRHPELAKFTGDYEFYQNEYYRIITVSIEDGKLIVDKPGNRAEHLAALNRGGLTFKGRVSRDPAQVTFFKNGSRLSGLKWEKGNETVNAHRKVPHIIQALYPVDQLKQDFKQFQEHLTGTFHHPFEFTSEAVFKRHFRERFERLTGPMTLREFYTLLVPLKAELGCGHSHLDYPGAYGQNHKFPLILRFLKNHCYLERDLNEKAGIPLYSEITAINGIKMPDVVRTLKAIISADGYNDNFKTAALENCFQYYYANYYGAPESFIIQFLDGNGQQREAAVPAIPCRSINYSNKQDAGLKCDIMPEQNAALLTIGSFSYYGDRNKIFFSYIDKSFQKINESGVKNLIIDLRGNGGGDPYCSAYLLSYIERESTVYFAEPYRGYGKLAQPVQMAKNAYNGKIFTLIDGSGFSTTGHFCSLLKYHKLGTFVGSETGGTYTCNGAVRRIQLKNTRVLLKIGTSSYAAAVEGLPKNRGIIPDYPVEMGIDDYRNKRDPVMAATLKLISGDDGTSRMVHNR